MIALSWPAVGTIAASQATVGATDGVGSGSGLLDGASLVGAADRGSVGSVGAADGVVAAAHAARPMSRASAQPTARAADVGVVMGTGSPRSGDESRVSMLGPTQRVKCRRLTKPPCSVRCRPKWGGPLRVVQIAQGRRRLTATTGLFERHLVPLRQETTAQEPRRQDVPPHAASFLRAMQDATGSGTKPVGPEWRGRRLSD